MALGALYIRIHFLLLLIVAAVNAQSKSDVAIQDTYQKLENSWIQNRFVLHQMQEAFFPTQNLPPDSLSLHVLYVSRLAVCNLEIVITLSYLVLKVIFPTARSFSGADLCY